MLNIYYANKAAHVPVRLFDNAGLPVTGAAAPTVAVLKADGTSAVVVPTSWTEVATGAFVGSGVYELVIPASATDVLGPLTICLTTGGNVSVIVIGIVSALAADAIANTWAAS